MRMHPKKKIEIVAESACAPSLIRIIEDLGATGYTTIPSVTGKGHRGVRGESPDIMDILRNVMIIVIASPEVAVRIVEQAHALLENFAGVVFTSDVEVIRNDHF